MFDKVLMGAAAPKEALSGWDLSNATYNGTPVGYFNVKPQETSPFGFFFKGDGTKMYVIGSGGDDVNEYNLSTAWEVSTASYNQNFSVQSQEGSPRDVFFKSDGTKMYILGTGSDTVFEYNLTTGWDISTASYNQSLSVASREGSPQAISFKPDGTKMYVVGSNNDSVLEYNLTTAWDISTASYNQNFSVSSQEADPTGLSFKSDGTKMFIIGATGDDINEYNLSTAWDVSTASYSQNFSIVLEDWFPHGLFFKPDGTKMYVVGVETDFVFQYSLSTAWDISTASYIVPSTGYFRVKAEDRQPQGLFFKGDGTKMYVAGSANDSVFEYNLSTAWEVSTASYNQSFSVGSQETFPNGIFFKPDGTKMYVVGLLSDGVNEYNLSTAWDVSTASYSQIFSVASQENSVRGLSFKGDGTKMYVIGTGNDTVNEYSLSTAWDVSTASHDQGFSVGSQETFPQGLFFKPDGTKMYVSGTTGFVNEYNLSTAWDVSTASYNQNFSIIKQSNYVTELFFKNNGTKMYISDYYGGVIWCYDL